MADGYQTSLDVLEYGIKEVLTPAIEHAESVLQTLDSARLDPTIMAGQSAGGTVLFGAFCASFAGTCEEAVDRTWKGQRDLVATLDEFRTALTKARDRYQKAEADATDELRRIAQDLDGAP